MCACYVDAKRIDVGGAGNSAAELVRDSYSVHNSYFVVGGAAIAGYLDHILFSYMQNKPQYRGGHEVWRFDKKF